MHIIHDTMQILIERNTLKHNLSQKYESSESHSKRKNGPCVSNLNSGNESQSCRVVNG